MISIYSLRAVYTFLYTIMNGNVIASFVQNKKCFEILWSKKKNFCVRTQPSTLPSPPLYAIVRIWLDLYLPPLYVCTMWMTPYISPQKGRKTEVFLLFSERKENIGPIRVNSKSK